MRVGPPAHELQARRARARPRRPRGGTSRSIRSAAPRPRRSSTSRRRSRTATRCALSERRASSIRSPSASQRATCSKASRAKLAAELPVDDGEDVPVELGGHAGGVVVGGEQALLVLDEVDAEEQPLPGVERVGQAATGTPRARRGSRLPIVLPRKATSRRPPRGSRSTWRWKSPTTACTSSPGRSAAIASEAARRVGSLTSKGTKRCRSPSSRKAFEEEARLLRGAGAELDERLRGRRARRSRPTARRGSTARGGSR